MTLTLSDLIKQALRGINVIGKGETPSDDDMQDAKTIFMMMLAQLSARRNFIRANTLEYTTLSTSAMSITIGSSGATWTTAKPVRIIGGFIRDSENIDYPIAVVSTEYLNSLTDKYYTSGRPVMIAYDPGLAQQAAHKGTIHIYPKPDVATYKLYIEAQKSFTDINALTDTVTFEPVYQEPLKYLLMVRLWRDYYGEEQIPADVVALAKAGADTLANINSIIPTVSADIPGTGGNYDIFRDG